MMELRVEHLCKRYGENTVLDDISFTARVGVTRLLGPSGIGKTTPPDAGAPGRTETWRREEKEGTRLFRRHAA